jgi:hypothetical protein
MDHIEAVVGVLGQTLLTDLCDGIVHEVEPRQVAAIAQVV